jgi:hypothetical protein
MNKRTPISIALLNPINLAMLALSLAAGLCSAWWLAPIGFVLWIIMVIVQAREPALQFSYVLDNRAGLATRFQKNFDQINRTHLRIFNTILSSKPHVQREMQPILKESSELIDSVYELCQQLTPVENNRLVNHSAGSLVLEMENLQTKIEKSTDPIVKQEYEQAQQAVAKRIEQFQHQVRQLERVDAQLISLRSELENLHSTILGLQSKDSHEIQETIPKIIIGLETEMDAFSTFKQEFSA